VPWSEGDNIPWNDPAFSERMLKEHLSQAHDAASRRFDKIDRHVAWIHDHVLGGQPSRILDLGCGPGLYSSRLAALGHTCTGVDFSPASIAYATAQAQQAHLACAYIREDIRSATYGSGFGLAMQIFGELNVFTPADVRRILAKVHAALAPDGLLLLEISTYNAIEAIGHQRTSWYSAPCGLFSDQPHIAFEEAAWDQKTRTATTRHYVIDAATAQVTRYAATYQAYSNDEFAALLNECGFANVQFYPSLLGVPDESQGDTAKMMAIVARRSQR
jgi:SAM-dependent methyltransferase